MHTWTRQLQFHPHLHVLVPAAALGGENCCAVIRAQYPHYLLPYAALAHSYRQCFLRELHAKHPALMPNSIRRCAALIET